MPASTFMPDIVVEIAFDDPPDTVSPTWTDVSAYVEARQNITINRGRSDELSQVQPSRLTVTFDNSDGRFTPGNASGAYYPNVRKNRMIRVTAEWPLGGGGVTVHRFHGYIDEWPVVWPDATDEYSSVTITASSRMARLALGAELPSTIEAEYLLDNPTAHYPLGEPTPGPNLDGQAGDVSGNQQANLVGGFGTGPVIQWQGATGPGTDDLSAPVFSNGRWLETSLRGVDTTSITLEAFINTSATPAPGVQNGLMHYSNISLTMNSDGEIIATGQGPTAFVTSTDTVNDGETHHVAYRETVSGGNVSVELFIDGVSQGTDSGPVDGAVPTNGTLRVGRSQLFDGGLTEKWTGVICHVALTSGPTEVPDARIAAHAESGLTGFEGESSDERIFRLAEYAGVDAFLVTDAGQSTSIGFQNTTGQTPLSLMQAVTNTEGGLLFDAASGDLVFHARDHRYNATSTYTLDASEDQVEASLEVKMDGQQLVNDITATGATGLSVRVTNQDSITEHGFHREQLELLTTDDLELVDAANWRVQRYGEPDVRISAVAVDLLNQASATISDLLDSELGDRITLDNLPDQAPDTSLDLFVEGITETIGAESYTIAFELSPAILSDVWVLDSASHSQLDETTVLAY